MTRVFSLLFLALFSTFASAQDWQVDYSQSRLALTASVYDAPFVAEFAEFEADIRFDPDNLEAAQVIARIAPASMNPASPGDSLYVGEAQGADWFSSSNHPEAVFMSESFTHLGGTRYEVSGTLQIKEEVSALSFPFELEIVDGFAQMQARFTVNRMDLGLGRLTHPTESTVKAEVALDLSLAATQL